MKFFMFLTAMFFYLPLHQSSSFFLPSSCNGDWVVEAVKSKDFYSNFLMKYPKSLSIKGKKAVYTNTYYYAGENHDGPDCSVNYIMDSENSFLVFKSCLPTKASDAFPGHYKIRCNNGKMTGSVYTYKKLFDLKGKRIN